MVCWWGGVLWGSDKWDNFVWFGVLFCDGVEVCFEWVRVGWLVEWNWCCVVGFGVEDDFGVVGVVFFVGEVIGLFFCCFVVGWFVIGGVLCFDILVFVFFLV